MRNREQPKCYSNVQSERTLLPTEERHTQNENRRSQNEVDYRRRIQSSSFWQKTSVTIKDAPVITSPSLALIRFKRYRKHPWRGRAHVHSCGTSVIDIRLGPFKLGRQFDIVFGAGDGTENNAKAHFP